MAEYKRIVSKNQSTYYYLKISLEFEDDVEINAVQFKTKILVSLKSLFGEVGKTMAVDILKYSEAQKAAIVRVPSGGYAKLRTSLTLCGSHAGKQCAFRIHQVSASLMGLTCDSRTYDYQPVTEVAS